MRHMKDKWHLTNDIKKGYTVKSLRDRMEYTILGLYSQNCKYLRTFIDVDDVVQMTCMQEAYKLKRRYKETLGMNIQLATQPLGGLVNKIENLNLFEEACQIADVVGCLPSIDGLEAEQHLDIAFSTAKRLNKPVEAHLDQLNLPIENETEMFCDFVEKYNFQGKARTIHSISVSCKTEDKQYEIAERLRELDVGVVICPSAAISMTQHSEYEAPIHNSIAPLKVLLESNVKVGLGVDNIRDLFMPLCDGDLSFELKLLAEATRTYDVDILEKIAQNKMGFV
tara:strand:+ start:6247 stop:7092 length:846 start_codon:yes stop_codon:yes gene_type:complete